MTHATDTPERTHGPGIRVLLVAPPMLAWGLERLVQSGGPGLELQETLDSVDAGFAALTRTRCDVLVAAVTGADDFALVKDQVAEHQTKLLVLSREPRNSPALDDLMLAGARGILHMSDSPALLIKAIQKVHEGEFWIDRAATGRLFMKMARMKAAEGDDPERTKIATLTNRERQTIAQVTANASATTREIASRLCISEYTLRNHLSSIYSKLDLCSRLDLHAYATRHRIGASG